MTKKELIHDCKTILKNTQNKKLQILFYNLYPQYQDIVIEKITKEGIDSFSHRMLEKFDKYIEK